MNALQDCPDMNDGELDKALKAAGVPKRSGEYWERFPQRVLERLHPIKSVPVWKSRRQPMRMLWGIGTAAACLILGLAVGFWQRNPGRANSDSMAESTRLAWEITSLFPHRVRAIISRTTGVQLVLSEQADVPVSTPLFVRICRAGKCESAITFSGQQIQLAGQAFEVLTDAQDHVLLVGNGLVWSSQEGPRAAANLKIEAKPLDVAL